MIQKDAVVRLPAVRPHLDVRHRPGQYVLEVLDPVFDLILQGSHLAGHVDVFEQLLIVAIAFIDKAIVDVRQRNALDGDTGFFKHPGLDRAIVDVIVLNGRRGFHLDHAHAFAAFFQDIRADQHAVVLDRGLDRKSTRLNSSHSSVSRMPSSA